VTEGQTFYPSIEGTADERHYFGMTVGVHGSGNRRSGSKFL